MPEVLLHFIPEFVHFALPDFRVEEDVMKYDEAVLLHERGIKLEVPPHPGVPVISVDEQKVYFAALQYTGQLLLCGLQVRVLSQKM